VLPETRYAPMCQCGDALVRVIATAICGRRRFGGTNIPQYHWALDEEPTIWTECYFADPTADIAVLGPVDGQMFFGKDTAYRSP
jgi:hypothetical protein